MIRKDQEGTNHGFCYVISLHSMVIIMETLKVVTLAITILRMRVVRGQAIFLYGTETLRKGLLRITHNFPSAICTLGCREGIS